MPAIIFNYRTCFCQVEKPAIYTGQTLNTQSRMMDSKQLFIVAISVSLVTIVVSITCAAIVGDRAAEWKQNQKVYEPGASSHQLCLPYHLLNNGLNLPAIKTLSRSTVEGQEMYCANNTEQASALMNMLMSATDDTYDSEPLQTFNGEDFSLSKASAHKQLTVSTLQSMNEPVFLKDNMNLQFDIFVRDALSEHVRNVEVMPTAMVVQKSGMYFVYSSIFFRPDSSKPCKSLEKQIWEHNIMLTRNNDEVHGGAIFNTTYKCCDECIGSKETSYTGGYLQLQENDRLHVEVSSDGVVSFHKEGSYFGLFMLN